MHTLLRVLLLLLALVVAGPAQAKVRVVATVPDLAAIASEVVGAHGTVEAMALPSQDPHFVDAKPSLALALSRADLLLVVGMELEIGWLPTLLTGARNPKILAGADGHLDCSTLVGALEVPAHAVDRSMGDLHTGGNPHYLYDPRNAAPIARGIAKRLGALDPANASTYEANAEAFATELAAAVTRWEARLDGIEGEHLIQYHRSFAYLEHWLGFELVAEVEPKPGIPPAPADVARIVRVVRDEHVDIILQEAYYPDSTSRLVASKAGVQLVRLHAGTDFARGETYIEHMDEMVEMLAAARDAR